MPQMNTDSARSPLTHLRQSAKSVDNILTWNSFGMTHFLRDKPAGRVSV